MNDYSINQFAYAGYYATIDDEGLLITGEPFFSGGVMIQKIRLYNTAESAIRAAAAEGNEAVKLVSSMIPEHKTRS